MSCRLTRLSSQGPISSLSFCVTSVLEYLHGWALIQRGGVVVRCIVVKSPCPFNSNPRRTRSSRCSTHTLLHKRNSSRALPDKQPNNPCSSSASEVEEPAGTVAVPAAGRSSFAVGEVRRIAGVGRSFAAGTAAPGHLDSIPGRTCRRKPLFQVLG